jgi:NAD(P)-dependent dehydrogenase (short-subunit alcohol dehydrogenase family)
LDGKLVIVTGGNNGIGFETTKGLAERGAEVIILARNEAKSRMAIDKIQSGNKSNVHYIQMDLADIESIINATKEIAHNFPDQKIDIIVANAGITSSGNSKSVQGYEKVFAVNVLGHHALFKASLDQSLLEENAHILSIAGDIYIVGKKSAPNYFVDEQSVTNAYCQSKLGCMWWAFELQRKYLNFIVNIIHPGVVATGLGGESIGTLRRFIRNKLMISQEEGAQTTLICATQPGIVNGGYYHNTMGHIILSPGDPGADVKKAEEFWNLLEGITSEYMINTN